MEAGGAQQEAVSPHGALVPLPSSGEPRADMPAQDLPLAVDQQLELSSGQHNNMAGVSDGQADPSSQPAEAPPATAPATKAQASQSPQVRSHHVCGRWRAAKMYLQHAALISQQAARQPHVCTPITC